MMKNIDLNNKNIAIIGLGYVGLPLATAFSKKYKTIGYDINVRRVDELNSGYDSTLEVDDSELQMILREGFVCTSDIRDIQDSNVYIVTVPTPIDSNKQPDLRPLINASADIGAIIKKGDIVIYESTVYPGATEEVCIPKIVEESGLVYNEDFFCGYSPERINPGDKEHTVTKILKVTSGSNPEISKVIDGLYNSVIEAGTYLAPSIKVAEAAKVIENSQRDINIAFVNELAKIFDLLDIDTTEVLKAAGTKWNFLPFKPGLVGGHCIGVDPYYLAQKAQEVGYHPEIILAGRRLNDGMGEYIAKNAIKELIKKDHKINGANALVLGITFKENCPDIRNTRVIDIVNELANYGVHVDVFDPWADDIEVREEFDIELKKELSNGRYGLIILAVAHDQFQMVNIDSLKANASAVVYDVKGILPNKYISARL